jgi:hypothetical protein
LNSLKFNKLQFLLGVLFLLAGTLEYIFSRPPGSVYFLIPFQSMVVNLHDQFNPFGAWGFLAPDFFHPLAFALMCMALLPDTFKHRLAICLAWFGINATLELTQKYGSTLVAVLPQWIEKIPVFDTLPNYLIHGTFDNYDLLAFAAGSLTAFFTGHLTKGGKNYDTAA